MRVRSQPTSQTPTATKAANGMPGMTSSQATVLVAPTQRVPSHFTARNATRTTSAAQPRRAIKPMECSTVKGGS